MGFSTQMSASDKLNYEMYLHWEILKECNFSCDYCFAQPKKGLPKELDVNRIIQRLDKFEKVMLISFTGGEPFLVPNFLEFIRAITKKHCIRIDTNLSLKKSCEQFMDMIDPEKVLEITFSVHISERERRKTSLEDLCSFVKRFQRKGFEMVGNYVVYPPLINRVKKDLEIFEAHGIRVLPTYFSGSLDNKIYPIDANGNIAYTPAAIQLITSSNPYAESLLSKSLGKPCQAGVSAFVINHKYEVYPCFSIKKKLGSFFEKWERFPKVIKCPVKYCMCPFNENFAASPHTSGQIALLNKTIEEKGILSINESVKVTHTFHQTILDITRQIHRYFKSLKTNLL